MALRPGGCANPGRPLDAQVCQRRFQSLIEGCGRDFAVGMPFSVDDATAGTETELQAVVAGTAAAVDLPRSILGSRYYANLVKRSAAQDMPKRLLRNLQQVIDDNPEGVWDNSWVRLPLR